MASGMSTPVARTPEPLLANLADGEWVVQKYGGTSVGKSLDSICKIVESYIPTKRVAVVCSARSSQTKALGTTNLLLQASREALLPASARASASGTATPFFPKRVGSGFFGKDASASLPSSVSSLRDLEITPTSAPAPTPAQTEAEAVGIAGAAQAGRSESPSVGTPISPSPFQRSGRSRSPTARDEQPAPAPAASSGAGAGGDAFHDTVDLIKRGHLEAARATLRPGSLRDELELEIQNDCENLRGFLYAAQIIDEISPRSQDSIVGTGERLACKIVAAALRDRGIDSELVVLDSIVDAAMTATTEAAVAAGAGSGDQGVAQLGQSFYDELAQRIGQRVRECGQRVPVITGYFGPVPGSLLAQIGRGYTDLCAALCAVGLSASELQVWKEVDGIFTADPRKVAAARLVPTITPDEAAELTYYGSEVIHPFTMEQVIRARIPIRIKNVENPAGAGTVIYPDAEFPRGLDTKPPTHDQDKVEDRLPTAVTIKDQIVVLNIHSNRKTISHGFLARIFGTLDRAGVVVDLISTSEVHVSMAMQDFLQRKRLDRLVRDLQQIGDVTVSRDMAILSLVGRNLRNAIGSAGAMFMSLARAGVNIEMISQGASEINISCVIDNAQAVKALNVIHHSCIDEPLRRQISFGEPTSLAL
ncbi:Aspartokinase [Cryptotrichosporon argae]